jgi:hypothetical protein
VVFTGDWIPDHELARLAGLAMDPGTRGPVVDTTLATSLAGVFAAGNLVHAAETADIAALSGRHAAGHIAAVLHGGLEGGLAPGFEGGFAPGLAHGPGARAAAAPLPVLVEPPLRWISPNAIGSAAPPPLGRFVLRSAGFRRGARLEVRQDGRLLARSRPARLIPGTADAPRRGLAGRGRSGGRPGARRHRRPMIVANFDHVGHGAKSENVSQSRRALTAVSGGLCG